MKRTFISTRGEYKYEDDFVINTETDEDKLARYEVKLQGLRELYTKNPLKQGIYKAQGQMLNAAVDLIKKKLSYKQKPLL